MHRRDFMKGVAAGMLAVPAVARAQEASIERKPNIIFIMADDLGYGDLGCYGQRLIRTPNIDALAGQGLRFTQAYAGGPVCTPSRSVLMTGLHNGHTVARDNIPHYPTYLGEDDVTMAEVLSDAGYRCGGVGKWSLGDAGTVGAATNKGFDSWFGYLNQDHAHHYFTEYLDDDEGRLELPGNTESREYYSHDLMADRAIAFIEESKDQPFFFYGAFTLPHFSEKSEDEHGLAVPSMEPYTDEPWDARMKKYAAMVSRLDRDVGRIVQRVDELGLAENTLIIFTSDNGPHEQVAEAFNTNGPLRGYKRDLTEGGIRVPFIARWPGVVPVGETSHEILAAWDMLPTFAELAGAKAPSRVDGTSVMEALKGSAVPTPHEYLYWDYGHCRDRYDQAVRAGKWKGIRLGQNSPIQLFDLENDVGETRDLAAEHLEIVERMEAYMAEAAVPHPNYPVGVEYRGKPIWKRGKKN